MKVLLTAIACCLATFAATGAERVVLYARLTENQMVDLTDGSKWQMDRGDCFPVVAYKEAHTKLVLQLAGTQFVVPAAKAAVVPDKEIEAAIVKYRANVNTYINGYASRWRTEAEAVKKNP